MVTHGAERRRSQRASRSIAGRLADLGRNPYASDRDRYLVLLDERAGEIVPVGRPLSGSRLFPSSTLRRDIECVAQIETFGNTEPGDDFLFWGIGLTGSKADVGTLRERYDDFNRLINLHFSEMRKRNGFELILLALHPRFDLNSEKWDLHAHFICRIPRDQREACQRRLLTAFSKADVPDRQIQNLAACATYMLWGICPVDETEALPDAAIVELWSLTKSRVQLVRTGGAFACWRRAQKGPPADEMTRERRLRVRANRAATADPRRAVIGGDRLLRKVTARVDGKPTVALLYEERSSQPPTPVASDSPSVD